MDIVYPTVSLGGMGIMKECGVINVMGVLNCIYAVCFVHAGDTPSQIERIRKRNQERSGSRLPRGRGGLDRRLAFRIYLVCICRYPVYICICLCIFVYMCMYFVYFLL